MIGDGNANAEIVVIDDFPNNVEKVNNKLYLAGTKFTYDNMLKSAGLNRSFIYTTCLIQEIGYYTNQFYSNKECTKIKDKYAHYITDLALLLSTMPHLKVLMPVGKCALNALCGLSSIANWRGSILPVQESFYKPLGYKPGWKVIPSYSPRDINTKYSLRLFSTVDLKRAKEECNIKGIVYPKRSIIVAPTFLEAKKYLEDIINKKLRIASDIECNTSFMTCISFAKSPYDGISVPFYDEEHVSYWKNKDEFNTIESLTKTIINSDDIPKIWQNGMFDTWYLGNRSYTPKGFNFDTMCAAHCLFSELPKDLGTLVSVYTKEPYYKFERTQAKKDFERELKPKFSSLKKLHSETLKAAKKRATLLRRIKRTQKLPVTAKRSEGLKTWKVLCDSYLIAISNNVHTYKSKKLELSKALETFKYKADLKYWAYNAKDSLVTYEIALKQEEELKSRNLWDFYNKYYIKLFNVAYDISMKGIKIDESTRSKIIKNLTKELDSLRKELYDIVGYEFNTASSVQMSKVLYETLGFKPIYTRKKTITTDAKALDKLKTKYNHEALNIILDIRKLEKIISTYLRTRLDKGYMRSTMSIDRTTSGRWSSSKSPGGSGGNLQNIPSGKSNVSSRVLKAFGNNKNLIRDCFIAPTVNHRFMSIDLSSADTWFVAFRANDETLIDALVGGKDVHKLVASICFNKPIEDIVKSERNFAKHLGHGFNYGMQPKSMARDLKLPLSKVILMYNRLVETRPAIIKYHNYVEQELITKRCLYNAWGRPRMFLDRIPIKIVGGKKVAQPSEVYLSGYSYIPQSSVADTINNITLRIWDKLKSDKISWMRIALQVHDELLFEYEKEYLQDVINITWDAFNLEMNPWGRPFIIPWDYKIGVKWGSLVELPFIDNKEIDKYNDGEWMNFL